MPAFSWAFSIAAAFTSSPLPGWPRPAVRQRKTPNTFNYGCTPFVTGAVSLPAGAWPETQELSGSAAAGWITGAAAGLALAMALPPGLLLGVLLGVLRERPAGRALDALLAPWVYGMGAAGPLVVPLVLLAPTLALGLPPRNLLPLAATMAVAAIPLILLLTAQAVATWTDHPRRSPVDTGWGPGHLFLYLLGGLTVTAAHLLAAEMALAPLKVSGWDLLPGEVSATLPVHLPSAWQTVAVLAGLALVGHGLRRWAWNLR